MTVCYLGLGSNLRYPIRQLHQALDKLNKLPRTIILKKSKIYFSQPLGIRSQPPYSNMVIAIFTSLSPLRLLQCCHDIEQKHHRIRKQRYGARTLDIDILLYGTHQIQKPRLIIPHPEMLNRPFVWVPLLEIAPLALMPDGEPILKKVPFDSFLELPNNTKF